MGSSTAHPDNLLDVLVTSGTKVHCDSLDRGIFARLKGRVSGITSNQAILYSELSILSSTKHTELIGRSAAQAKHLFEKFRHEDEALTLEALAVDVCALNLALEILPGLEEKEGLLFIQVNALHSTDSGAMVRNGLRLRDLLGVMVKEQGLGGSVRYADRVVVKVPSTWEGIQACRILEREYDIRTTATTCYSVEQAALAAEVGCSFVAPYVNEIGVHLGDERLVVDGKPDLGLPGRIQRMYDQRGVEKTKVFPASLASTEDCMRFVGAGYLTAAAPVLEELVDAEVSEGDGQIGQSYPGAAFDGEGEVESVDYANDEKAWREALESRDGGVRLKKTDMAIKIFSDMQKKLENLVKPYLNDSRSLNLTKPLEKS